MATCDNCMSEIDVETETHLRIVKPMELKGERREVTQYYCSFECLQEKVGA